MKKTTKARTGTDSRGMTLVEVIISIALFGILAAMTMLVMSSSLMLALRSEDNTAQVVSASSQMDTQMTTPSGVTLDAYVHFTQDAGKTSDPISVVYMTTGAVGSMGEANMESFVPTP